MAARAVVRHSQQTLALSGGTPNNHFDVTVEELLTLTAMKTMRFRNKPHVKGHRVCRASPVPKLLTVQSACCQR